MFNATTYIGETGLTTLSCFLNAREKYWWKTGTDRLASHGLDTEVWVSLNCGPLSERVLPREELLNSESHKDSPDIRTDGVEDAYWLRTESGLIDIPHFPGVIYATDGSHSDKGMGAGFYRHDTKGGGCCKLEEARGGFPRAGLNLLPPAWPTRIRCHGRTPDPSPSLQTLND